MVPLRDNTMRLTTVLADSSSNMSTTRTTSSTGIISSFGIRSVTQSDMSVSTNAGAMADAVTPRADSSRLTVSRRDSRAALDAP